MVLRVVFPRIPKMTRPDNVLVITRSAHTPFPKADPGALIAILPPVALAPSPVVVEAAVIGVPEPVVEPEAVAPEVVTDSDYEVSTLPVTEVPVAEVAVDETPSAKVEEAPAEAPQWDATMKKADLLSAAEARGLDIAVTATRAEILSALKAAEVVA